MRLTRPLVAALVMTAAIASSALAQTLTDADVDAALALSSSKKPTEFVATTSWGAYETYVFGRLARIAYAAAIAKKQFREYTKASVDDALKRDEVSVLINPSTPIWNRLVGGYNIPSPITRAVLRSKDGSIIQPIDITFEPRE